MISLNTSKTWGVRMHYISMVLFQGRIVQKKKWIQTDGNFGVIIGVTEKVN